ncbi:hypothetical protein SAMN04487907_1078 [Zunongwangia mangrovi]|uniref:Fasciclin domain-containing protein n=1 Tax=Zunongwangia mangrovi TaxID=1334022 RepID=A0A1I1L780_9FLAO|nr:hypothetical protein [Zunongwangia mangrovi]SFC66878.1 hypothetical protein SAMN04487907_1078 [Zunongwangia mangrovi]
MKNYFLNIAVIVFLGGLLISCDDSPYLTDEGVHDPNIEVSKVEYLEQNDWELFDTLVLLIDHYDMREEVNNAATFFAATDYAFAFNNQPLDSIYSRYPADTIRDYIFNERIMLEELAERGSPLTLNSASGKEFQVFTRTDNDFFAGERWSSVEPDFLYLTKIIGENIDPIGVDPITIPFEERDISVRMQTQGIIDPDGNMMHVISNTHSFGFN